jgi:multiple sugar transport system permease protein
MIYYSPSIVSGVVSATIWLLIFGPRDLANQWLNFLAGNASLVDYKWLALPAMARLATIIIYLAGLVSIPASLYEVAEIDGAG